MGDEIYEEIKCNEGHPLKLQKDEIRSEPEGTRHTCQKCGDEWIISVNDK